MSGKAGEFLKGLLVGGAAGIILGILYAPKSGKETREGIGQKAEELLAKTKEDYEKALEKSKRTYESALERLRRIESAAKSKLEHVDKDVSELVEHGKDVMQDGKSRLKRALDAGVEAFKEEPSS